MANDQRVKAKREFGQGGFGVGVVRGRPMPFGIEIRLKPVKAGEFSEAGEAADPDVLGPNVRVGAKTDG